MDVHTRSCSSIDPGSLSGSEPANSTELRKYNPIYNSKIKYQSALTLMFGRSGISISAQRLYILSSLYFLSHSRQIMS